MELALPSFLFLLTSILLLVLSLWFLQKKVTQSKSKVPPGPWTLPFIGSLHHFLNAGLSHHALHDLARLYGPIMLIRAGEVDLVVLTSREAAEEVMKTQDANFANRPVMHAPYVFAYGGTDIVLSTGAYWRQLRRICNSELLSSKQVKCFCSIREEEINSLLNSFSVIPSKSPANLTAKIFELTNNIIIRAAFGGKCKNRGFFLEILREVLEVVSVFNISDLFPSLSWLNMNMRRRVERLHRKLDLVLEDILHEHLKKQHQQKKGGDQALEYDLVDVLINLMENGDLDEPITMDNIKAVIMDVLIAGTETSASTITWAMAELIRHPEIMAKAQAEIRQAASKNTKFDENALSYLRLVIKETLRMHPPAPLLLPRLCQESCQILGYTIPSGARIVVNAWALGRNPDYWEDPENFKPERFERSSVDFKGHDFRFLPFGAGRRICPGIEFAVTLVEEAIARTLLHFDWSLPNWMKPEDLDMMETFGLTTTKKEPLYLIPTMRVPLPNSQC
ncbi:Cytochrome P450 [Rhynchospora pubera]|uniref:Cytochrome P450 n=1 Tax=Rhynchospora pubera TaxID=906938 RepID=A0AAV8C336_9POAL|nr:Cytochrome P450 [Rhynchospora pubera]